MDEVTKVIAPSGFDTAPYVSIMPRGAYVLVAIVPGSPREAVYVTPPNRLLRLLGVTFAGRVQRVVARAQKKCERRIMQTRAARDIAESYQQE